MLPDAAHPERGSFVRDQVAALRTLPGVEVELHQFPPGPRALASAGAELRRRFGRGRPGGGVDVVHAHFGLTAWPALAVGARVRAVTLHGTDLRHPRTRLASVAALGLMDIVAVVSGVLGGELPSARLRRRALTLPCGVDTERFRPIEREQARRDLDLQPDGRYLLFAADPRRPGKRHDRALELACALDIELLTLGGVAPDAVPSWVNASDAVLVPSEQEGFGLAVLEALACDVPVLATPVGIHPQVLEGVQGALCAPYDLALWSEALAPHLRAADPRIVGRARAEAFSTRRMAARVLEAWRAALQRSG
jgi:teichuronic acid biosynthesis glycosyltransferase TuaC